MLDKELEAGCKAVIEELQRGHDEQELYFKPSDMTVDGRIDLSAIVTAVIEAVDKIRGTKE